MGKELLPSKNNFGWKSNFFKKVLDNYIARACLKKAFCKMYVTICGRFCSDEGAVAGYGNRIRAKYTAKWGVQIAGMIFQTGSKADARRSRKSVWILGLKRQDRVLLMRLLN